MPTDNKRVNTGADREKQIETGKTAEEQQEDWRSQVTKEGNGKKCAAGIGENSKERLLETISLWSDEYGQEGTDEIKKGRTPDDFELIIGQSYQLREGPPINGSVTVEIALPVMVELVKYAASDLHHEHGGFLLGQCWVLDDQVVVGVTAWVEAKFATHRHASLTFTHRDWEYLATKHERLYSDLQVVGWFHTHPGFGVFLSSYDLFIHRHFFSTQDQIALVIDPVRRRVGVFIWRNGEVVEGDYRIVGEERSVKGRTKRELNETGGTGLGEGLSVDSIRKELERDKSLESFKGSDQKRPSKLK